MECFAFLLHNHECLSNTGWLVLKIIKRIFLIAICLLLAGLFLLAMAFGSKNQEIVTVNYLLAQGSFHLSSLLGAVFVLGFSTAWIVIGGFYLKVKYQKHRLGKKLKKETALSDS